MKDPAFLFYPSDFLTGVSDLTFEERGQYITLLCLQHQKGRLTQKAIALCCGNATADVLQKFDIDEEGLYFNKRLEAEIEKRAQFSEKQRERAVKGWEKRKDGLSHGNATAMPLVNRDINVNTNTLNTEKKESDFGFSEFWDLYGKKEDRKKCERKWKLLKQSDRDKILLHVPKYVLSTPDIQYRKNPYTYLNNDSWENEIVLKGNLKNVPVGETETERKIREFKERGF